MSMSMSMSMTMTMTMPRSQRAYVIAMCAIIAAAFAYAASNWGQWTHVAYLPVRGELAVGDGGFGGLAMHYYGLVLWGFGGLVVGGLAGALLCRAAPRPWPPRALNLLGAWAVVAILLAGGYFTWSLWPW